jgi:hypothetical protein
VVPAATVSVGLRSKIKLGTSLTEARTDHPAVEVTGDNLASRWSQHKPS